MDFVGVLAKCQAMVGVTNTKSNEDNFTTKCNNRLYTKCTICLLKIAENAQCKVPTTKDQASRDSQQAS